MSKPPSESSSALSRLERAAAAEAARADRLQATLDRLADQVAGLTEQVASLTKMLRRRDAQLAKSEAENRKLRRKLGLDDPEPEPDAAAVPELRDGLTEAAGDGAAARPGRGSRGRERAEGEGQGAEGGAAADAGDSSGGEAAPERKRREGGRRRPPAHLPADVEPYPVRACGCCGGRVLKRDVEENAVYSAVRSYVRQRVILRERVVCADLRCGAKTTAPTPPMPCERALFDCSFIAWLVTMKFAFLMPLDRIQAMLASQGVHLATGTLVHLIQRATSLAEAVDGEHMRQLRAGKYICFDGTGLKVLMPGERKAWDGYLEVFTRDELTVFQFDLTKDADALRDRLEKVTGVLVADAEARNKKAASHLDIAHCNAHVVRAFRAAEAVQPRLAKEGRSFLDTLYALEDEAKALGLTGAERAAHRRRGRPTLDDFRRWLVGVTEGELPPSDPVVKVAAYYLRHWEGLTRFMDDPDLPLDNNAAEREFQRHAKLRFASLFAGSEEGAHRWATLLGVVRTAQKHGLDVQAYLTWMFERRGTHKARFGLSARQLTPAAYKAAGCPGSLVEAVPLAA